MVSIKTLKIWSESAKAIVNWAVALETETDEGGNESKVYTAKYKEEILRFSPNITDVELEYHAEQINNEHKEK